MTLLLTPTGSTAPPPSADGRRFRVLLCVTPGTVVGGDVSPGVDVRRVSAAELSVGADPATGNDRPWRKFACRLGLEAGVDAVVLADADGDVTDAVSAVVAGLRDDEGELVRCGVTRGGTVGRLVGRLIGRPAGPAAVCGYAAALLGRVPFDLDADGPMFDLHLLLQAAHVGAAVRDVGVPSPGPTPPPPRGRPGVAWLTTAVQFRLHRVGMLCALRYRNLTPSRYGDKTAMLYTSHAVALRLVRERRPRTVLDLGCGPGFIAARCRADGVRVTGVDAYDPLPGTVDEFHRSDLDRGPLPIDAFAHDVVLLLDVIEHLADPESFLLGLRNRSTADLRAGAGDGGPRLILSTPNVAFAAVRLNLLAGRFTYAERGILDVTHKRLFTRRSLLAMLRDCGYAVERTVAVGVPAQTVLPGRAGRLLGAIGDALARAWPSLFAFQLIVVARPRPSVGQLLRDRPALLAAVGGPDRPAVGADPG